MAFNGNLSEFGVVALLQLPGANNLSGKLALNQSDSRAEFYYRKGRLVHASLNDITGKEALVQVVDWVEGDFTFDSNAETETVSIKQDLQNILMWALKERDERKKVKEEEEKAARDLLAKELAAKEQAAIELAATEHAAQELAERELAEKARAAAAVYFPDPVKLPQSLLVSSSVIQLAFIINAEGEVIAEVERDDNLLPSTTPVLSAVSSFIRDFPERTIGKIFIEDLEFSLAVSGLSQKLIAVIFVPHNTRPGVLSIELTKFVRALQASGLEIIND